MISSDGQFALSGSWDGTLRLWDLNTGNTTRRFVGHTKDVLSVAFSVDNRQVGTLCCLQQLRCCLSSRGIRSVSKGQQGSKACSSPGFHRPAIRHTAGLPHIRADWRRVRCPACLSPLCVQIVSGSRDKTIRLWNTLGECKYTISEPEGHTGEQQQSAVSSSDSRKSRKSQQQQQQQ